MGDDVNESVILVLNRHPVTQVTHSVLLEELAGMIAETGMQGIQLSLVSIVGAQFIDPRRGLFPLLFGGKGERKEQEQGSKACRKALHVWINRLAREC